MPVGLLLQPPSPCGSLKSPMATLSEQAEATPSAYSDNEGYPLGSEVSWCSTCSPEDEDLRHQGEFASDVDSPKDISMKPIRVGVAPAGPSEGPRSRKTITPCSYIASGVLLGGGNSGIVQKGVHATSGRQVAIKRLQRDARCPIRFLEVNRPGTKAFHAEGFVPVGAAAKPWSGSLVHVATNAYATVPFESDSVEGKIVLVRRGGGVSFGDKVCNAHRGCAAGVLFINTAEDSEAYCLGANAKAWVPSMMLGQADGEELLGLLRDEAASGEALCAEVRTDSEHEVALCRRLPIHPNIIQVLDAWHEGESMVVVSEICTGGKLASPFAASSGGTVGRSVATILWLIKQILAAVAHLHEHGVCHRDIKAQNMLLTRPVNEPQARLVLIDFSMASLTERMCVPCGSARYCAPEVIRGKYGRERDIWSVGVLAYELLFGIHPFAGGSDSEVLDRVSSKDPCCVPDRGPAVGTVSDKVRDLVQRLLEKDPSERITPTEALMHASLQDIQLPTFGADAQ